MTNRVIPKQVLFLLLPLISLCSLKAQTIQVTTDENNFYYFSITDVDEFGNPQPYLNPQDLVYYHFSDGLSLQNIANSDDPVASVKRQFKDVNYAQVIAYIARKNGPLELATGIDVFPLPCATCQDPLASMPNDKSIKLSTSWTPFTASQLPSFTHNITSPTFPTPEEAWFFLNVHLEDGEAVRINIPEAFSVEGVIINEHWAPLVQGNPPNYAVGLGSEFKSIEYTSLDEVLIEILEGSITDQAQLSLLLKGNPGDYLYTLQTFQSTLYFDKDRNKSESFKLKVRVAANPHDPNKITAKDIAVCTGQSESAPYTYRVDFQNLGEGFAEDVIVYVDIDETIMDAFSIHDFNINSTHDISSININSNQIAFHLDSIYLLGLVQEYPYAPTVEDTKGKIRFKLKTHPCIEAPPINKFYTAGLIRFICCYDENGENPSIQDTPMDSIEQKFSDACGLDPSCLVDFPDTGNNDIHGSGEGIIYPNPFSESLFINLNPVSGPVQIRIEDVNGITQDSRNIEQLSGEVIEINTQGLASGTYFVSIIMENEINTYMIVKP